MHDPSGQTSSAVTAVIITRDRVRMLSCALDSVLQQVEVGLDVVVVDEGSSDGTAAFLAGLDEPRLRVIRHDSPRGPSAARNAGLAAASGEWVGFLDDDDLWAPDKLSCQLHALGAAPECQWSCVSALHVDERLRLMGASRLSSGEQILERLLAKPAIPGGGSGVVARTALLREVGGFREDLRVSADWECWIRLAMHARLAPVDRLLMAYRVHGSSISHDVDTLEREYERVLAMHAPLAKRLGVERRPELYLARQELRSGRRTQAARRFLSAAGPGRRRNVVKAAGALVAPGVMAALGAWRWRRSLKPGWVSAADEWLKRYEGETVAWVDRDRSAAGDGGDALGGASARAPRRRRA